MQALEVQNQWTELQESLFKECHNTFTLPPEPIPVKTSYVIDDQEHVDGHNSVLGRWRTQFDMINEKIKHGDLASAHFSINSLIQAMEFWESKSSASNTDSNELTPSF